MSRPESEFSSEKSLFRTAAIRAKYRNRWGTVQADGGVSHGALLGLCMLAVAFLGILIDWLN